MDALVKSKKRCSIELPPEPEWVLTSKRCAPTRKEACAFETVDVQNFEKKSVARDFSLPNVDLKYIGCGVGRCVYEFKPGCVVKFARSRKDEKGKLVGADTWGGEPDKNGEDQNLYEVSAYRHAEEYVKDLLVPVFAHSAKPGHYGRWIVAPKIKSDDYSTISEDQVDEMKDIIRERGAYCRDVHSGNIGFIDSDVEKNKFVLIDYGFSVHCKRSDSTKSSKSRKKSKKKPVPLSAFLKNQPAKDSQMASQMALSSDGKLPNVKALNLFQQALERVKGKDANSYMESLFDDADKKMKQGKFKDAIKILKLAHEVIDKKEAEEQKFWEEQFKSFVKPVKPYPKYREGADTLCSYNSDCGDGEVCAGYVCREPKADYVDNEIQLLIGKWAEIPSDEVKKQIQPDVADYFTKAKREQKEQDYFSAFAELGGAKELIKNRTLAVIKERMDVG